MKIYLGEVGSAQGSKTLLPSPGRKTSETTKEIRRQSMLSSGKTVVDVIAKKKIFTFDYSFITGPDLDIWFAFIGSDTWEIEIERRDGSYNKYSVRFSEETKATYQWTRGEWLYENVSFTLEEI